MSKLKITTPNISIIRPGFDVLYINPEISKNLVKQQIKHRLEIVFFGSDDFVIPILQALEDNFDVIAVVTAPDSPVANSFKGPILTPDKLDEEFITYHLSFLTSDLFVVASYGKILPSALLKLPKFGALNVHPSLLPKFRGPSPVPATILSGERKTGVTIIKMDAEMDHGPIVATKEITLSGQEDTPTLITKLFQLGAELLVEVIPDFVSGRLKLKEQDHSKAIFCKIFTKKDGYFDIDNPPSAEKLDRMIRAYFPWPGVWTKWNGKIVKLHPRGVIQMEGKKPISFKDFLNGYPDFPIKQLLWL